jgi:hypothetical protein
MRTVLLWGCLFLWVSACSSSDDTTLFRLCSVDATGIHFANRIQEDDTLNILKEEYIYNGGGVGIGDFNNDGLQDIYFTGNMVSNALYLNHSNMTFEDITTVAQVGGEGRWCSGVALVDINEDGWLDIYVSATLKKAEGDRASQGGGLVQPRQLRTAGKGRAALDAGTAPLCAFV